MIGGYGRTFDLDHRTMYTFMDSPDLLGASKSILSTENGNTTKESNVRLKLWRESSRKCLTCSWKARFITQPMEQRHTPLSSPSGVIGEQRGPSQACTAAHLVQYRQCLYFILHCVSLRDQQYLIALRTNAPLLDSRYRATWKRQWAETMSLLIASHWMNRLTAQCLKW